MHLLGTLIAYMVYIVLYCVKPIYFLSYFENWAIVRGKSYFTHFWFTTPPLGKSCSLKYIAKPVFIIVSVVTVNVKCIRWLYFLSAFIRGECLCLSLCSVACLITHGILLNWTLQTLYQLLLVVAGGATQNSTRRHCSRWQGNQTPF